jgi:MAF protein
MCNLVLASSSSSRRNLLNKLELSYDVCVPDVDESPYTQETAYKLVERLAILKAKAVSVQYSNHLIIGADSVADHDGEIVGKPGDYQTAKKLLSYCSGKEVKFYTGLALLNSESGNIQTAVEVYTVKYRILTDAMIDFYLHKEQPYGCAGGVKAETRGLALFEYMRGDDFYALLGLPLLKLVSMLANQGVEVLLP